MRQENSTGLRGTTSRSLLAIVVLSVLGVLVAGYLTYAHYNTDALVCAVGDCGTVQESSYARIGPVPISILGIGMYLALGALAALRLTGRGPLSFEHATIAAWTIALMGTIYAAYLTYVEIWVIDAICQWCVLSAIIGLIILIVESIITWDALLSDGTSLPEASRE